MDWKIFFSKKEKICRKRYFCWKYWYINECCYQIILRNEILIDLYPSTWNSRYTSILSSIVILSRLEFNDSSLCRAAESKVSVPLWPPLRPRRTHLSTDFALIIRFQLSEKALYHLVPTSLSLLLIPLICKKLLDKVNECVRHQR